MAIPQDTRRKPRGAAASPFCLSLDAHRPGACLTVSKLALRVMRGSGIFSLTRACSAKMARILMYHNFSGPGSNDPNALSVEGIRTQFHYLRRHYKVVPLMQIAEQLASG